MSSSTSPPAWAATWWGREGETPLQFGEGTDCVGPLERLIHIKELAPEICTLDCGTLNFGDGQSIVVQTPTQLRQQAALIKSYGVKPEMEIFDSGNLWFANQLVKEGLIDGPPSTSSASAFPGAHLSTPKPWPTRNRNCRRGRCGRPSHWPSAIPRRGTGCASAAMCASGLRQSLSREGRVRHQWQPG